MNEHDKREIEYLIQFKKELEKQIEEDKELSEEERIKKYIKCWREESNESIN